MVDDFKPGWTRYLCEFVGTFLLVFTIGCNVLAGNPTWAVTSIASVLMVSIYAMGSISGAHFNPAVTTSIALCGKMDSWLVAAQYMVVQLAGGLLAGVCYLGVFGRAFNLQPGEGFGWGAAMTCEILYTFMLCFVVLNVACCSKAQGNEYYGLAIGFVIIAGGYAAGPISGGVFNPAVAFGIDVSSMGLGFGWSFAYLSYELTGAAIASLLFAVVHPEEFLNADGAPRRVNETVKKLTSEFLGTYFLVLTVGLNVLNSSPAAAWSIAASLMCMIYSLGNVSGAHFNPAVTLAIFLSGRRKIEGGILEAVGYMFIQVLAGILAGVTYTLVCGTSFGLGPGPKYGWVAVCVAEVMFTFILCFVVLNVATVDSSASATKDMFGLAIGMCVTVGGYAIGAISGGSLNPAVSIGLDTAHAIRGGFWSNSLLYSGLEFAGAAVAALVFFGVHPSEYMYQKNENPFS
jgi:aquaporin Z